MNLLGDMFDALLLVQNEEATATGNKPVCHMSRDVSHFPPFLVWTVMRVFSTQCTAKFKEFKFKFKFKFKQCYCIRDIKIVH